MKTLVQTGPNDSPREWSGVHLVELHGNTESERWENEGGSVNQPPKERSVLPLPVPKRRVPAEYPVLISGLLIVFGLVTLILTIGAKREEAETAAAMVLYGGCSVVAGVAVAAIYWVWRNFQECRP
jgi:hypothetical protein